MLMENVEKILASTTLEKSARAMPWLVLAVPSLQVIPALWTVAAATTLQDQWT